MLHTAPVVAADRTSPFRTCCCLITVPEEDELLRRALPGDRRADEDVRVYDDSYGLPFVAEPRSRRSRLHVCCSSTASRMASSSESCSTPLSLVTVDAVEDLLEIPRAAAAFPQVAADGVFYELFFASEQGAVYPRFGAFHHPAFCLWEEHCPFGSFEDGSRYPRPARYSLKAAWTMSTSLGGMSWSRLYASSARSRSSVIVTLVRFMALVPPT